jgi:hypothetical protein
VSAYLLGFTITGRLTGRDPDAELLDAFISALIWPAVVVFLGVWYALAWVPEPRYRP